MDCSICNGYGRVAQDDSGLEGSRACEHCGGTGKEPDHGSTKGLRRD